jgi:hypothetical protein
MVTDYGDGGYLYPSLPYKGTIYGITGDTMGGIYALLGTITVYQDLICIAKLHTILSA